MPGINSFSLPVLSRAEDKILLGLSFLGLVGPNGVFIGYGLTQAESFFEFFKHPLGFCLMLEAFFLMFFFAWLIRKSGRKNRECLTFIGLTLAGSLFFSVPFAFYWVSRNQKSAELKKISGLAGNKP